MSTILLAVSDRWVPDARVTALANFATRLGHSILAVHVAYATEAGVSETSPGEKTLKLIADQLRAGGVKVETLLLFGDDLGHALLKVAEEHDAKIIALGLSSKGILTRLIEGNVSQEVIRAAKIPLLLLPPGWTGAL